MHRPWFRFITLMLLALAADPAQAAAGRPLAPNHLRTEYLETPLGIDTDTPRFSWWMRHDGVNEIQTAYRVLVASTPELLRGNVGDLWDSGKTPGDRSVHVEYQGRPLTSRSRCYWKVRTWDREGRAGPFSDAAWFEMALLNPADFRAQWIQGAPDVVGSVGYQSAGAARADDEQWVEVDLREAATIDKIVLCPSRSGDWARDDAGFGFPLRYRVEVSKAGDHSDAAIVYASTRNEPDPGQTPREIAFPAREVQFIRVTATRLYCAAKDRYLFALSEIEALDPAGKNIALSKSVNAKTRYDEIGWGRQKLVDGIRGSQQLVSHSPLLRKAFTAAKPVLRARAYVSGLGYYELHLNGAIVGDRLLDPPYTAYAKHTEYSVYDVTDLIRPGENVVGLMLGHGWWGNTTAGWAQLRIDYADGTSDTIVTDPSWKYCDGPILFDSLYHGETYDARHECNGWDAPGYDDRGWATANPMPQPPAQLVCQTMPPIRVTETLAPVTLNPQPGGKVLVDFGQNHTGRVRIRAQGPAGTEIVLRHAELLHSDGTLNPENLRSAKATDRYTLKGEGVETYAPRFTQHGYRYVEVSGYPGELKAQDLCSEVFHTALVRTGTFACSNELFNDIDRITRWSMRSNMMSIPTDCPQRDERMGWMGDAHLAAEAIMMEYDAAAFYENWLRVIADTQSIEGYVADVAPRFKSGDGDPAWAAAYPLITWYLYRYYGDERALREHYPNIVRWFHTLETHAENEIVSYNHYGDWVSADQPTPAPLISTGIYCWTAQLLAQMATALERPADARHFADKSAAIAAAFNAAFYDRQHGYYGNGSQFSQVWPLYLGIVPDEWRASVLGHLQRDIVETRQGHLATGILGTKYLFDVLNDNGLSDTAYTVALQKDYPGWGYMIANGATTLWELWKLETGGAMNSHNHVMFGGVVGWFYGDVAGINTLPEPGYRRFTLAPQPDPRLDHASARIDTVRGTLACAWQRAGAGLELTVDIPPNSAATLILPDLGMPQAQLSLTPAIATPTHIPGGFKLFLGSGRYTVKLKPPSISSIESIPSIKKPANP